jgi:SAM-dependent methyltransferase
MDFEILDGVPYLMVIEEPDFLSLVEIAGEFDSSSYRMEDARELDDTWPDLLTKRHEAQDKDLKSLIASLSPQQAHQLEDRYEQWREIWLLSRDIDLVDKKVLVVGAGLGFDTNLLLYRGAKVTAVDLNPQTNAFGRNQTPKARWVGAIGRRLPFIDQSFDYVFISASLHHVLDVSATIVEMLRLVKVGGSLITTNDSFSRDATTDLDDARMWNDHRAVLRGINENTPRLKVFIDPVLAHNENLDIEFWTSRAFGVWVETHKTRMDFLMPRKWSLRHDAGRLRDAAGGLFMRLTPREAITSEFKAPGKAIAKPSQLREFIGRKREAMAFIAHLAPPAFLSPRFPAAAGNTKFQVLNGWRWREESETGREACLLGRWWVHRAARDRTLYVTVKAPDMADATDPLFSLAVDGEVILRKRAHRGESVDLCADMSSVRVDAPIAIEIAMDPDSEVFEQGLFRVERLSFVEPGMSDTSTRREGLSAEDLCRSAEEVPGLLSGETAVLWREIFLQQREWGQSGSAIDIQPGRGRSTRLLLDLCDPGETVVSMDYDDDRDPKVIAAGGDRLSFIAAGGEELGAALAASPIGPRSARFIYANPRPMFTVVSDVLGNAGPLLGVDGVLALNNSDHTYLPQVWAGALHAMFSGRADLKPFLIAHNVAYFCHARAHGRYMRFVRSALLENIVRPGNLMLSRTDAAEGFDVFRISPRAGGEVIYGETLYRAHFEV